MKTTTAIQPKLKHNHFLSPEKSRLIRQLAERLGLDLFETEFLEKAIIKTLSDPTLLPRRMKHDLPQTLRWIERNYRKGDWIPEQVLFGHNWHDLPRYSDLRHHLAEYQSQYNGLCLMLQRQTDDEQSFTSTCKAAERCLLLMKTLRAKMQAYREGELCHESF